MATSDKLQKLLETKEQIRQAIIDKGVEVGEDTVFADYSNKIAEISGGSDDFLALRTSNHTNYSSLFEKYEGDSLEPFALGAWDTSNVTDMRFAFSGCEKLISIDLSNWFFDNVVNVAYMFDGCTALEYLDIRKYDPLSIKSYGGMLSGCSSLRTLRLDYCENYNLKAVITSAGFPTGLVDGETRKMWVAPKYVENLTAPDGWEFVDCNTGEVIAPEEEIPLYQPNMFREDKIIEEVSVMVNDTHTDLLEMFQNCENLRTINGINEWDTSNVTNMRRMFYNCRSLESLDLSSFNTSNVENMWGMFINCENLKELNLSNWDMTNVSRTDLMFRGCIQLHTLRLYDCNEDTIRKIIESKEFPTGEAEDYEGIRKIHVNPDNIGDLTAPDDWIFVDLDGNEIVPEIPEEQEEPYIVATFGTDESVDMLGEPYWGWKSSFDNGTTWKNNDDNMTEGNEIVYLKPIDTGSIKIYRLFEDSSYVTHIELHNFSDYPVHPYADFMFSNCSNLTELDLSSLNFSNGMNTLEGMFNNCRSLESLNLSNFEIGEDCSVDSMLNGCNKLHTLRLDNCNEDTISKIIWYGSLPTGLVNGETRKLHCKQVNAEALARPDGWEFVYVD
jgi:surface protein